MIKDFEQFVNEGHKRTNSVDWDEVRQHPIYVKLIELGFDIKFFEDFDDSSSFYLVFEVDLKLHKLKNSGELTPHSPDDIALQFYLTTGGKIYRKIFTGISVDQITLDRSVFAAGALGRSWTNTDPITGLIIIYNRLVKVDSDLGHKYGASLDFTADPDLEQEAIDKRTSDQIKEIW